MRLIRITTNYSSYLKQFYAQRPNLKEKPSAIQYQTLMADCFGWADFWTHALSKLGYEVWEPVGNAKPIQIAWAKENGIHYKRDTWLTDIIRAQVKSFQPDVLFVDDYITYTAQFIRSLRRECSTIRLVLGWCGAPYEDESVFHSYDIVLSNIPELVEHFCMLGHHAKHLNHAFAPQVLAHLKLSNRHVINFSFIGSIVKGNLFHRQRERLIKELVQSTDLEIFSDISHPSSYKIYLHQMLYDAVHILQKLPFTARMISAIPKVHRYAKLQERPSRSHYVDAAIAKRKNPPLFGIEMFQTLYQSQVALNTHIDLSPHSASNMRLFEVTGVGTCLLTDWKENLSHVFEPEREVVTYRSPEECIEKVNWLLEHPKAREAIARAGQARTLHDHTFAQRAAQLDEIIKSDFI